MCVGGGGRVSSLPIWYTPCLGTSLTPKMTSIRLTEYKRGQSENGCDQRERRRQTIRPAALSTSANLTRTSNSSEALLTLFTTFKESSNRNNIQTNTILNWASLGPKVQPLVFTNLSSTGILVERARKHGWIIAPLQRVHYGGFYMP